MASLSSHSLPVAGSTETSTLPLVKRIEPSEARGDGFKCLSCSEVVKRRAVSRSPRVQMNQSLQVPNCASVSPMYTYVRALQPETDLLLARPGGRVVRGHRRGRKAGARRRIFCVWPVYVLFKEGQTKNLNYFELPLLRNAQTHGPSLPPPPKL
jgi:hypothetical protein